MESENQSQSALERRRLAQTERELEACKLEIRRLKDLVVKLSELVLRNVLGKEKV